MKRTCLALSIALIPTIGTAQEFTRYPGLSPQQQHLLEPIRTPPPAPSPSPPVQSIQPPASVQSTTPHVTQYPGSGNMGSPIDRSERRVPRDLKQTAPPSAPAVTAVPPQGQRVAPPLASQTPGHWQTVTLPPAPDFSRTNEPARAIPRLEGARPESAGRSENAVRALIEADGYRGVSGLTRGAGGTWRGRALRGSTEIGVVVDANGRVSAE